MIILISRIHQNPINFCFPGFSGLSWLLPSSNDISECTGFPGKTPGLHKHLKILWGPQQLRPSHVSGASMSMPHRGVENLDTCKANTCTSSHSPYQMNVDFEMKSLYQNPVSQARSRADRTFTSLEANSANGRAVNSLTISNLRLHMHFHFRLELTLLVPRLQNHSKRRAAPARTI